MKVAVLSDIHGNMVALEKVLEYIKDKNIERIFSLGDLIGGDNPKSTIQWAMKEERFIGVAGNHDSSYLKFEDEIEEEMKEWVYKLPLYRIEEIQGKRFLLVHATLNSNVEIPSLYTGDNLESFLKKYNGDWDYVLFGHTHYQCLLSFLEEKTLINPGSVGISYDNRISFGIIEIEEDEVKVEFIKIDKCF